MLYYEKVFNFFLMVRPKINKLLTAIAVLSFIALFVTGYLMYIKFAPSDGTFCFAGGSCEVVNNSPWSVIDLGFTEIPVSVLGFLTYLFIFVMSIIMIKKAVKWRKIHPKLSEKVVLDMLKWLAVIGSVFSLWLTYVEAFILQAWCEYCVTQQIIILIITALFFKISATIKADMKENKVCEFC